MKPDFSLEDFVRIKLAFGLSVAKCFEVYNLLSCGKNISAKDKEKINKVQNKEVNKVIEDCKSNDIKIITIDNAKFPDSLRNISAPPIVLFIKGELPQFEQIPTITIVGPRNISEFGARAAYSLGLRLSKAGFCVVSGAAVGGDSEALKGALKGEGIPVGVLACGILCDYLPENRGLRKRIAEKGCLISEQPPRAKNTKYSFPIRNRLMAALSLSTVVIEAGEKSGALITAKYAAEQGKDVFVIPGNPTLSQYKGSNALLRDGAIPLIDASDVFALYLPKYAEKIDLEKAFEKKEEKSQKKIQNKSVSGLSKNALILYNNIVNIKFSADDMLKTGLSGDEILSSLTELEISGFIKSLPGGLFEVL